MSPRGKLDKLDAQVLERIGDAAKTTDSYVREHPWGAVGIAAAAGLLVGVLISRRLSPPMSEAKESGRRPWFGGSLRRVGDSVLGLVETRLQILALEWAEERMNLSAHGAAHVRHPLVHALAIVMGLIYLLLVVGTRTVWPCWVSPRWCCCRSPPSRRCSFAAGSSGGRRSSPRPLPSCARTGSGSGAVRRPSSRISRTGAQSWWRVRQPTVRKLAQQLEPLPKLERGLESCAT